MATFISELEMLLRRGIQSNRATHLHYTTIDGVQQITEDSYSGVFRGCRKLYLSRHSGSSYVNGIYSEATSAQCGKLLLVRDASQLEEIGIGTKLFFQEKGAVTVTQVSIAEGKVWLDTAVDPHADVGSGFCYQLPPLTMGGRIANVNEGGYNRGIYNAGVVSERGKCLILESIPSGIVVGSTLFFSVTGLVKVTNVIPAENKIYISEPICPVSDKPTFIFTSGIPLRKVNEGGYTNGIYGDGLTILVNPQDLITRGIQSGMEISFPFTGKVVITSLSSDEGKLTLSKPIDSIRDAAGFSSENIMQIKDTNVGGYTHGVYNDIANADHPYYQRRLLFSGISGSTLHSGDKLKFAVSGIRTVSSVDADGAILLDRSIMPSEAGKPVLKL